MVEICQRVLDGFGISADCALSTVATISYSLCFCVSLYNTAIPKLCSSGTKVFSKLYQCVSP